MNNDYAQMVARTVTNNQRAIAALTNPQQIADPNPDRRQALIQAARRAASDYVRDVARATATMIRELFPTAASAVFEQNNDGGDREFDLLVIFDADGTVLWYDDESQLFDSDLAQAVTAAEQEQGKLLIPRLDDSTRRKIQYLIANAQECDWDGAWYTTTDLIVTEDGPNGRPLYYDGNLWEITLDDELAGDEQQPTTLGMVEGFDYDGFQFNDEFPIPSSYVVAYGMAHFRGPDGHLWFAPDGGAPGDIMWGVPQNVREFDLRMHGDDTTFTGPVYQNVMARLAHLVDQAAEATTDYNRHSQQTSEQHAARLTATPEPILAAAAALDLPGGEVHCISAGADTDMDDHTAHEHG